MSWIIIIILFIIGYLLGNARDFYINKKIYDITGIKVESDKQQQLLGLSLINNKDFNLPFWLWFLRISSWIFKLFSLYLLIRKFIYR